MKQILDGDIDFLVDMFKPERAEKKKVEAIEHIEKKSLVEIMTEITDLDKGCMTEIKTKGVEKMKKLKIDGKKYRFEIGIRRTGKSEVFEYEKKYEDRYRGRKDLRAELEKASPFIQRYGRYILNDVYPRDVKAKVSGCLTDSELEKLTPMMTGLTFIRFPESDKAIYRGCKDIPELVKRLKVNYEVHSQDLAEKKLLDMRGELYKAIEMKKEKSVDEIIKDGKGVSVGEVEYLMPKKESEIVLSSLKRGKNVLIVGSSGCGKSKMVLELAKQEGKEVARLPLNGGCTDASFIGEKGLRTNEQGESETFFQYGILPDAMKNGKWLLLDELDFCQPEYLATLQAVFEGNNTPLTLADNGGEKIYPHKDFRIIATANTLGRGDTNGYHGTNMLNIATLDRWTIITMDYTPQENKLLARIVNSEIADKMVAVAKRVRNAIKIGELPDYVFSTRRLLHWAEAVVDMGFELGTEAEVLGRLLAEERKIIGEFIYDTFGKRV